MTAAALGEIDSVSLTIASNILSMIIGALLKQMSSQSDFFFGSSIGSKTKDDANREYREILSKELEEGQ